jgi:hypothetical protein
MRQRQGPEKPPDLYFKNPLPHIFAKPFAAMPEIEASTKVPFMRSVSRV